MRVDYLTGVFNRRHLEECLRKKMSESSNVFAGIMLDIDNYKSVNDTYGHLMGDRALIDFANSLQKSVGKNDIVARYGGDEFVLIVNAKNEEQLEEVIFDIRTNIARINDSESYPFKMHASLGAKIYTRDRETTMEKFLNQLDDLMYQDKKHLR
jgi:diguanylate cyclase (GGDEF)-like protein